MKTILITGGAGFIGSNFVNTLFKTRLNMKILVLDSLTYAGNLDNFDKELINSDRFEFWYGSILNQELVQKLVDRSDIIFHFAAETHVARSVSSNKIFFETDVLGTQILANATLNSKIEKFIHISTSEVYGTAVKEIMDEKHPLNPCSPYAAAKAGADRLIYSYYYTYDLPMVIIRPFNQYGPKQHIEKAIPRFITRALRGLELELDGGGIATRDWVYVFDTIEALIKIIDIDINLLKGKVINLGTGKKTSVKTIAEIISSKLNLNTDRIVHSKDRSGQVQNHKSSVDVAKKLLNWEAKTNLKDGIEKTIKWFRENQNWWEKNIWLMDSKQSKQIDPHEVVNR